VKVRAMMPEMIYAVDCIAYFLYDGHTSSLLGCWRVQEAENLLKSPLPLVFSAEILTIDVHPAD